MKDIAIRQSSRCEDLAQEGCVGVGRRNGQIIVQDVTPAAPEGTLSTSRAAWGALATAIKNGVYDL